MSAQKTSILTSILITTVFVLILWWVKLFETILQLDLHFLGVFPLSLYGLIGILTAPLVHGSWQHVIGNSVPLLLMGSFLIYGYPKSRWWTIAIIWLLSGLGVWLLGRENFHIGASGLAHGIFFFLFLSGIFRRDKRSSAIMMIAFYMYGSMLLTIFPREEWISFESHLFGALSGAFCAILFRHWDPKPKRKVYDWENESEPELPVDKSPNQE
ncbi:rhomboid family intramembrane serine protease [Thalassotalea aquiviva]|uniref:rhomboid family intramembrane serine protease n=1 Tax=Thalassotalea aquiviva TaxID=3242415 RepID=UPI00352AED98